MTHQEIIYAFRFDGGVAEEHAEYVVDHHVLALKEILADSRTREVRGVLRLLEDAGQLPNSIADDVLDLLKDPRFEDSVIGLLLHLRHLSPIASEFLFQNANILGWENELHWRYLSLFDEKQIKTALADSEVDFSENSRSLFLSSLYRYIVLGFQTFEEVGFPSPEFFSDILSRQESETNREERRTKMGLRNRLGKRKR